jgi:hypothetical protein
LFLLYAAFSSFRYDIVVVNGWNAKTVIEYFAEAVCYGKGYVEHIVCGKCCLTETGRMDVMLCFRISGECIKTV